MPPTPEQLAVLLTTLRERSPLVQCLTNTVAANWTANVLLAAGAAPAMVDNVHEAGVFATIADGVLVNLGMPQDDTAAAMALAVTACADSGTPWVLDPVAVGGLPWRTGLAHDLLAIGTPRVIRGNASEIGGLSGGAGGRGVDSTDTAESVLEQADVLAYRYDCAVAVSGPVDHIVSARARLRMANGDPLLTRVTGVGCSLGALMAAYAAIEADPLTAAAAATAHLTVAAEQALEHAGAQRSGPGSFAVHLLDALAGLQPDQLAARVRLEDGC